jgi:predicted metal-binding protein
MMTKSTRRPVATPAYAVPQAAAHQILVCKVCKHYDRPCTPGFELMRRLRAAIASAGLSEDFEVSGTACLAGCATPCTVAWRASGKATWLFGDVDPDQPLDELIAFSRLYARLDDGWCSGADCPPGLRETTLARIPAAIIVTQEGLVQ